MGTTELFDHDGFARSVSEGDFRRQVKRTLNGEPLDDRQVQAIADFVVTLLDASDEDHLLDVGCGNGELLSLYSGGLASVVGIDPSEYLINVSIKYFASDRIRFVNTRTVDYLETVEDPERFTRVCFFASFQYLSLSEANTALQIVHQRFPRVDRIVLGNLPDLRRRESFASGLPRHSDPEAEHLTAIGRWFTGEDIERLALDNGFSSVITSAPEKKIVVNDYRFHAILKRTFD